MGERSGQGELGGALQDGQRRRRDVGAGGRSLGFGKAHRPGDQRGRDDSRDDESQRQDEAGRRGDEGDDANRAHADHEGDEGGQQSLDHDVADFVDVGPGAGHQVAAAQRRQGGSGLLAQAVVEVGAQGVHAFESDLVRGQP